MKKTLTLTTILAFSAGMTFAQEVVIHTGGAPSGEGSTYHEGMGQAVEEVLDDVGERFGYDARRIPSGGAVANAAACADDTTNICFGILQGGLEYPEVQDGRIVVVRSDLPGECAMTFTQEPRLENWRSIIDNAARVQWVVGATSGSRAFVEELYATDANFAGITPNFEFAEGRDAQLRAVAEGRGRVGFFFAFPNPTAGTVKAAYDADMRIFGVLSPDMARVNSAYYLERQAPYSLAWLGFGETQTTRAMCAGAMLAMTNPQRITDVWAQGDAEQLMQALQDAPTSAFTPQGGPMAGIMGTIADLSERAGIDEMVSDLGEQVGAVLD